MINYQYMEDTIYRFSSDKIYRKIEELEKGGRVEEYKKRWLWELTQNAKDCAISDQRISIKIMVQNGTIIFSHDGSPFDYNSLMNLVLQNSSKRIEYSKTGKFGTGFISTHLISKKVTISGHYIDNNKSVRSGLNIVIDRNFSNVEELEVKLRNTIEKLNCFFSNHNTTASCAPPYLTSFNYEFSNTDINLINDSIEKFCEMAPFVLAFNKDIKRLMVNSNNKEYVIEAITREKLGEKIEKVSILKNRTEICIIIASDEDVYVSTRLEEREGVLHCTDVRGYPKLFCDFPMIGTENFSFPLIVNAKSFDMQQERNGIYPESDINRNIFIKAIKLYKLLLEYLSSNNTMSMFNCCYMEGNGNYFKNIYEAVRDVFKRIPIIRTLDNRKLPLLGSNYIVPIPSVKEKDFSLWEIVSKAYLFIPIKDENLYWLNICPENVWSIKEWAYFFQTTQNITFLKDDSCVQEEMIELLNCFYECWINQKGKEDFILFAPILLQNGKFTKLNRDQNGNYNAEARDLIFDSGIDEELKDVYDKFFIDKGEPTIRSKLVDSRLRSCGNLFDKVFTTKNLVDKISGEVRRLLSEEQAFNEKRKDEVQKKYNMLTDWFNSHRDLAKELFSDLYEKRYNLTNHEEMTRRLHNGDLYEEITKGINRTPEEIREILQGSNVDNPNLNQYIHNTVHSIYSLEKYNSLRSRSIRNVFFRIKDKSNIYKIADDVSEWIESTDNVFQAKKIINDREIDIRIVVRPADDNKIIFYEQVELEAMDELSYELWIDDGKGMVKSISLAELIVMTGINMIPLKM